MRVKFNMNFFLLDVQGIKTADEKRIECAKVSTQISLFSHFQCRRGYISGEEHCKTTQRTAA